MTKPFDNHAKSIGDLSLEHGEDKIAIYGSLDIDRSRKGLALARQLKAEVDAVVAALETDTHLPEDIAPEPPGTVANPFA